MKKMQCSSCSDDLEGEEIESPREDKDESILCDACFEDKYTHSCPVCEEWFDEDFRVKISPKYLMVSECVGDHVGIAAGVYEILSYPFFADGIINLYIFKSAVQRLCDVPPNIRDCNTLYYICNECAARVKQDEDDRWLMR